MIKEAFSVDSMIEAILQVYDGALK
jgi:hypothetical protein